MKKQIANLVIFMMLLSLVACGKDNSTSTLTNDQDRSSQTEANFEATTPVEKEPAAADFEHPSEFVAYEGDSTYFTPITDDYVIGFGNDLATETQTELTCFDENGAMVLNVCRILYSSEQEAKDSSESFGMTIVNSKEDFKELTLVVVGNAIYASYPVKPQDYKHLNDCSKMKYFYRAADSDSQMNYWFSIPSFTEEQLAIKNYCIPEDFIGSSHFEAATEDYLLTQYVGNDYTCSTLLSYDEGGKCVQSVLYYQYVSEEIAKNYVGDDDSLVRCNDGIYCYTEDKERIDAVSKSKEIKYFDFIQYKDKSEVDYNASKFQTYFSIPSLTEAQSPEYQQQIKELNN